MKKLLLISCLFGMLSAVGAQTIVSGTLTVDSTLSVEKSPYHVTSSIIIEPGVTLTVDSGVVVEFSNATNIEVRGALVAFKATFTSVDASAERGAWNGIQVGNYYNNGAMDMSDCSILFAKKTYMYKGAATIHNTSIQNASEVGLLIENAFNLGLTSSTISASTYPMKLVGFPIMTTDEANNLQGNDNDQVQITGSTLAVDYALPYVNVAYNFISNLKVTSNATLTVAQNNVLLVKNVQVDAGATLVALSNTIFKIANYYDGIYINGTLTAIAEPSEYIYFTSSKDDNWGGDSNNDAGATDPASESWEGVRLIGSESSASSLIRCKVRYAGYNDRGGITLTNSSPTINHCDIATNYYGIYIEQASNPVIANTTIGSSDMTPIAMSFDSNPVFSHNILSFSDNEYDAIGLVGGTMTTDGHIIKRNFTGIDNITYLLLSKVIVPETKTLTIDPGVVIKAYASYNNSKNIVVEGTLIADGTEDDNIIFTSAKDDNHGNPGDTNKDGTTETPEIGDFGAIVFAPTSSSSSSLTYSSVKYARGYKYESYLSQYVTDAAVITVNCSPTISHNQIKDVTQGIRCYEASSAVISDNEVINVSSTPFAISPSASPVFSGNSFTNAGVIALGLLGGDMTQSGTLQKTNLGGYENIAYSLLYPLVVKEGTYMNVDPGVVIKVDNAQIFVEGGLKVQGTESEKVIFTSIKDDNCGNPADANGDGNASTPTAGDWAMIRFEETSDDDSCLIENAEIRYGGRYKPYYSYYFSTIEISNANPTIKNTSIGQGLRYGVKIEGNSAPLLESVNIQNMEYEPIGMSLTSNPSLTNLSFVANRAKGLAIIDAELASDATLITRDVADVENIAYVINDRLRVMADARLTINPGVNVKFRTSYGYIDIEGALIADGESDEMIVFTSIKDDSRGGDTNDDGNTAPPLLGDWRGIHFMASGLDTLNVLNNVSIRYGGYNNTNSLSFNACTGVVSNSSIELSDNYGLEIVGSASPEVTNNDFYNIEYAPIYMSMFSEPTFSGNSMSNVGRQAIQLIPEVYSKTDTFEMRDFAGIDSITYCLQGNYEINDGTTITVPAGMSFKSTELARLSYGKIIYGGTFIVNGKVKVEGEVNNPVTFTNFYDDSEGRPKDMGSDGGNTSGSYNAQWFVFKNVSDDDSYIDNALLKYSKRAIDVESASPTINYTTFDKCERGIYMSGVSEPEIKYCTFNDLALSPIAISLVAFPSSIKSNSITGTTYKVIEVNEETLTQDITLPKRSFGGIPKIPYYFDGNYTVGTGAVLTIDTGVVCKFNDNSLLTVEKGLLAQGASEKENNIVFTHITDDFYGGDSNSDSSATVYNPSYGYNNVWKGIKFVSTAINNSCILDYCVFRNIYYGSTNSAVEAESSSPTVSNTSFANVPNGVTAKGSANPVVNNCDFYNIKYNGVNNVDESFLIDATNNWWGDNSGPTHTSNPDGIGVNVSDMVNYSPWVTVGANNPILGDVSQNGDVQAYDAALILKSTVGTYVLSDAQKEVADVSGNQGPNGVSALDASLVLRYSVGLIEYFEATTLRSSEVNRTELSISDVNALANEQVELPISVKQIEGTYALQFKARYNPDLLTSMTVETAEAADGMSFTSSVKDGVISISMAGTKAMSVDGDIAVLRFTVSDEAQNGTSEIQVLQVLKNEVDMTASVRSSQVIVTVPTNLEVSKQIVSEVKAYPNPFTQQLNLDFNVLKASHVSVEVYNQYGQLVNILYNAQSNPGEYKLMWNGDNAKGSQVNRGLYFVRCIVGKNEQVLKVQMY